MPDKNTFAKTLRFLLEDNRISQRALASQLGLSVQAVNSWCSGKNYPECDMLLKLAAIFGESTDYLLTGNRPENKSARESIGLDEKSYNMLSQAMHGYFNEGINIIHVLEKLLSNKKFYIMLSEALHNLRIFYSTASAMYNFEKKKNMSFSEFLNDFETYIADPIEIIIENGKSETVKIICDFFMKFLGNIYYHADRLDYDDWTSMLLDSNLPDEMTHKKSSGKMLDFWNYDQETHEKEVRKVIEKAPAV